MRITTLALLVMAGCAAAGQPADPPIRDAGASIEAPLDAAPYADASAAQQQEDAGRQADAPDVTVDARDQEATPGAAPTEGAPLPSIDGVIIQTMTRAGEGAESTTRLGSDGCFETTGAGGRGDGSTSVSKSGGCIAQMGGLDWLQKTAEILRGAKQVAPREGDILGGTKSGARVILLDEKGSRWVPAEPAMKRRLATHSQKLFGIIEGLQAPQAGPPTSKGWRLLTLSVESASGGTRFTGTLSSSGHWHCERVQETGARRPYDRRSARMGLMPAREAETALDRILAKMRPAPEDEDRPEGGVQRLVEVERAGTPSGITASRRTTGAVIKAWRRQMGKRGRVCAATSVRGR